MTARREGWKADPFNAAQLLQAEEGLRLAAAGFVKLALDSDVINGAAAGTEALAVYQAADAASSAIRALLYLVDPEAIEAANVEQGRFGDSATASGGAA